MGTYMTVRSLIRDLNEMDPKWRVRKDKNGNLLIGKDHMISIPSEIDHEIESIHMERQELEAE